VTTVEDKIRAATRAEAAALRAMPPLRLPSRTDRRLPWPGSGPRAGRARRLKSWIAPVTAAAVVIALASALVIVRDIPNARVVPPVGPVRPIAGVPAYYVTLYTPPQPAPRSKTSKIDVAPCAIGQPPGGCSSGPAVELLVGDTFTGARVALIRAPGGGSFSGVVAAADDRTFVADAESATSEADTWYLLRITPGSSTPARLTRLSIPALTTTTTSIAGIALSGSGRELAVALQNTTGASELRIYAVGTGRLLRTWSTNDPNAFGFDDYYGEQSRALTWIDDDRAVAFSASWSAFPAALTAAAARLDKERWLTGAERARKLEALVKQYGGDTSHMTWRRVDVADAGGDLMADSEVIWSWAAPAADENSSSCEYGWLQMITADGKTVMCSSVTIVRGTERKPLAWRVAWLAFSLPAGAPRTLYQVPFDGGLAYFDGLWTSASGGTVIGEWGLDTDDPAASAHLGVLIHGKFERLPTAPESSAVGQSITW
jgi:hypothetical protein